MRGALFTLMVLAVAGCGGPPRQWEKPDADRETAKQDLRDCRRAATNEARRIYPENIPVRYPSPITGSHPSGRPSSYFVRRDNEYMSNDVRLTGLCMRNKGYEFNRSPTELSPTSRPRST